MARSIGRVREQQSNLGRAGTAMGSYPETSVPHRVQLPYDDFTSTYQCQGQGSTNLLGYSIEFTDLPTPK